MIQAQDERDKKENRAFSRGWGRTESWYVCKNVCFIKAKMPSTDGKIYHYFMFQNRNAAKVVNNCSLTVKYQK